MSRLGFTAIAAALLAACTTQPIVSQPTAPPSGPATTATSLAMPAATATPFRSASRVVLRSSSLSLIVEDPATALAEFEPVIEEAGGFISSASSWPAYEGTDYASLSARVPPEALPELRRAALELANQIQSQSSYSQDVTVEYNALLERLLDIRETEGRLLQFVPAAGEPAFGRSVILLSELLRQERRNLESQIQSYDDRAELASLDITFNGMPSPLVPFETGTPTPIAIR